MSGHLPPLEPMRTMPDGWEQRGGVAWSKAPLPSRWHRCRIWQVGYLLGRRYERCACGGIRYDSSRMWFGKNGRRKAGHAA